MADELAELMSQSSALTKDMAEATKIREKEHKQNAVAIENAIAGQDALKKAMVILKEFYGKEDEASLLEGQSKGIVNGINVPEMKTYRSMGAKTGGILGMMDVILSDFARLESETKADEAAAAEEYDKFMADADASKKEKHEIEFKLSMEKDQAEFEKGGLVTDLEARQGQLATANQYFEKLRPSCLQDHHDQENRAQMRADEIEALQQTYKALSDPDSDAALAA